jgi:spore germination cell wall hydrolase CwlJ-like protein
MRKTLLLIILLATSQFTHAHHSAVHCVTESVYHEGRSLSKSGWLHIAAVIKHRSETKGYPKTMCGVVSSKQFTTNTRLYRHIKEPLLYKKIKAAISDNLYKLKTSDLFFSSNRKGRMRFH